jgi:hypothetical protein
LRSTETYPRTVHDIQWRDVEVFPAASDIAFGELFSFKLTNNTNTLTHGLHRFPAKFIPQIPAWALSQFSPTGRVLDPFMGSGTALVEGLVSGAQTIGVDIDPLAKLIAIAKSGEAQSDELHSMTLELRKRWRSPMRHLTPPMPDIGNFGHWFPRETWGWLQALLGLITRLQCSEEARRFLLVVFSSILRRVSFADDQTQKTYVSGTLKKDPPEPRGVFWRALSRAIAGLTELEARRHSESTASVATRGDACSLPATNGSVDLIVTSPPYLDSVDYMYNMMLEYFWLGPILGVPTRGAFNRMRREGIGAKNPTGDPVESSPVDDLLQIAGLSASRKRAARAYFDGMNRHFQEASRVLVHGGRHVMVVGNSSTSRGVLPVHEGLVRLAHGAGLTVETIFGYRVRRHYMKFPRSGRGGIILLDWIVVLRNLRSQNSSFVELPRPWLTLEPHAVAN